MIYAAAVEQLAALRDEQSASRATVEVYMTAFETAERELHAAQRQEAQLTDLLRNAQRRTAHLQNEFEVAEARLREAAEHLAKTQSLCHCLESQIATHAKSQRSALLLTTSPPSSTLNEAPQPTRCSSSLPPPSEQTDVHLATPAPSLELCWMDPYSVLYAPSGRVFSYDLVAAVDSQGGLDQVETVANMKRGNSAESGTGIFEESVNGGDGEGSYLCAEATVTSLLKDVVHDVLQGFNYTLLSTSAAAAAAAPYNSPRNCGKELSSAVDQPLEAAASRASLERYSLSPGQLTRRLLVLLQEEAARCGTRALSVSLAVGEVLQCPSTTISAHVEDVLRPFVDRRNAAAAVTRRGRQGLDFVEGTHTVLMDAVIHGGEEREKCEAEGPGMARVNPYPLRRQSSSSRRRFEPVNMNIQPSKAPSVSDHATTSPAPSSIPLTGVVVRSISEADGWLADAGLLSSIAADLSHTDKSDDVGSHNTINRFSGVSADGFGMWRAAPLVILLGVDSQDAAGKVHKSLLRIVHDAAFSSNAGASTNTTAHCKNARNSTAGITFDGLLSTSPCHKIPQTTSSLFLFMLYAIAAVLRCVCTSHELASTPAEGSLFLSKLLTSQNDEAQSELGTDLESLVELVLAEPHRYPSTAELRAAVLSISSNPGSILPCCRADQLPALVDPTASQQMWAAGEEWTLWAALLKPVFGGNSKALWLHTANSAAEASTCCMPRSIKKNECCRFPSEKQTSSHNAAASPTETTLLLSSLFCRLVRHDAVPCEVSANLDRLLREGW